MVTKLIITAAILLLPFQLIGMASYFILVKSDQRRAHKAVVLIPAVTFLVTFSAIFLWRYFHPGMLMLAEGAINLMILIFLVVGTFLNLICGTIVHFILYRFKGKHPTRTPCTFKKKGQIKPDQLRTIDNPKP